MRSRHVTSVSAQTLKPILEAQLDRKCTLMTDGEGQYRAIGPHFARHDTVNHGIEEYVRGDAHTNTIEGYSRSSSEGSMVSTTMSARSI